MILTRSFMWNLKPSGKVINLEVESLNGILLVMNDGQKLGAWNDIISSLGKSLLSIFFPFVR